MNKKYLINNKQIIMREKRLIYCFEFKMFKMNSISFYLEELLTLLSAIQMFNPVLYLFNISQMNKNNII